jgi:hypothetical protein
MADGSAYVSNESGQNEVYVRPFTIADGKPSVGQVVCRRRTASCRVGGGMAELFYRSAGGDFMAVGVKVTGETIQTSCRASYSGDSRRARVGCHRDGQRFLISNPLRSTAAPVADPVTVVLNWKSTLAK